MRGHFIQLKSSWLGMTFEIEIYNIIHFGVFLSSSAVRLYSFSMAQDTVEGGVGEWQDSGRGRDGFLRCIVIKAS